MSLRNVLIALAAGGTGVALGVLPALAADAPVTAGSDNRFTPATVTIAPGDSVTWKNAGGFHNVRFDDSSFEQPASPSPTWSSPVSRTFDTAGEYRYYCAAHGGPDGAGMAGKVVVATGATAPTEPPPVSTFSVKPLRTTFCNRASKRCTKPGLRLRITLTNDDFEELRGTLRRRPLIGKGTYRAFGTLRVVAREGTRTYRFQEVTSGKRIPAGRYSVALRRTAGGNASPAVTFRITT